MPKRKLEINLTKTQEKALNEITYFANKPIPARVKGHFFFEDYPKFKPNLSPEEILRNGAFGGTYFRPIYSSVTNSQFTTKEAIEGLPDEWFEILESKYCRKVYDKMINKYKETCGGDLNMWESSGWITAADPYGWFQWYCRFFTGRRCSDDERQVSRGLGVMGPTGRWRKNLINKCKNSGKPLEIAVADASISPKIRQLLMHWAYELSLEDLSD
jgi:hypothetical protein